MYTVVLHLLFKHVLRAKIKIWHTSSLSTSSGQHADGMQVVALVRLDADQKHMNECTNKIVLTTNVQMQLQSLLTILSVHEHLPICQGSYHMPSSPCPQKPHMCHSCCWVLKATVTFLSGHAAAWTCVADAFGAGMSRRNGTCRAPRSLWTR